MHIASIVLGAVSVHEDSIPCRDVSAKKLVYCAYLSGWSE